MARTERGVAEHLTLEEQETVIRFDRAGNMATVETHEPSWIRSLRRRKAKELSAFLFGKSEAVTFEVPKSWVSIRPKRAVSAVQREASRLRAAARTHDGLFRRGSGTPNPVPEIIPRGTGPNPGPEV